MQPHATQNQPRPIGTSFKNKLNSIFPQEKSSLAWFVSGNNIRARTSREAQTPPRAISVSTGSTDSQAQKDVFSVK